MQEKLSKLIEPSRINTTLARQAIENFHINRMRPILPLIVATFGVGGIILARAISGSTDLQTFSNVMPSLYAVTGSAGFNLMSYWAVEGISQLFVPKDNERFVIDAVALETLDLIQTGIFGLSSLSTALGLAAMIAGPSLGLDENAIELATTVSKNAGLAMCASLPGVINLVNDTRDISNGLDY